jgi:hypothetical protein
MSLMNKYKWYIHFFISDILNRYLSSYIWTNYFNKKFWEELIAYFPLIRHEQHRKRRLQQFLVAAGMCLPSRCLEMIRRYTDRPTKSPLIRHAKHIKWCVQQFFCCCVRICCRGNVSTEPLPSKARGDTHINIQTNGKNVWSVPLKWVQAPWYTYKV